MGGNLQARDAGILRRAHRVRAVGLERPRAGRRRPPDPPDGLRRRAGSLRRHLPGRTRPRASAPHCARCPTRPWPSSTPPAARPTKRRSCTSCSCGSSAATTSPTARTCATRPAASACPGNWRGQGHRAAGGFRTGRRGVLHRPQPGHQPSADARHPARGRAARRTDRGDQPDARTRAGTLHLAAGSGGDADRPLRADRLDLLQAAHRRRRRRAQGHDEVAVAGRCRRPALPGGRGLLDRDFIDAHTQGLPALAADLTRDLVVGHRTQIRLGPR